MEMAGKSSKRIALFAVLYTLLFAGLGVGVTLTGPWKVEPLFAMFAVFHALCYGACGGTLIAINFHGSGD